MSGRFNAVILIAVVCSGAHAAAPLVADDAPKVELSPGQIDLEASRIYVRVGKRRLGHEHGVEGRVKEGELQFPTGGRIVFDMTTFTVDTDDARKYVGLTGTTKQSEQNDVTKTMQGTGVLDASNHPTATFDVAEMELLDEADDDGRPQYRVAGEFTLHGKKKDISFTAAVSEPEEGRRHVTGSFVIKQSDYGIKPYSAFFGTVAVTDELKIWGDLWIGSE